jgi:putative PIN family toxin of toxin-antitoxin system
MKCVLDTNVVVAGIRSPLGASAAILKRTLSKSIEAVCSVPLFLEYEEVLLRPEHLSAAGISRIDASNFLDVLASVVIPVEILFLWRPQLRDPDDDMVLELAVNALGMGDKVCILTFNKADFLPEVNRFGIELKTPKQFFERN